MNNLTFGDEGMGYYETIAGGAGAGPHWHGRSGVHTHMTNTCVQSILSKHNTLDVALPGTSRAGLLPRARTACGLFQVMGGRHT